MSVFTKTPSNGNEHTANHLLLICESMSLSIEPKICSRSMCEIHTVNIILKYKDEPKRTQEPDEEICITNIKYANE